MRHSHMPYLVGVVRFEYIELANHVGATCCLAAQIYSMRTTLRVLKRTCCHATSITPWVRLPHRRLRYNDHLAFSNVCP